MAIEAQMYLENLDGFCYDNNFRVDESYYNNIPQKHHQQLLQQVPEVSTMKIRNNNNNNGDHWRSNLDNMMEKNKQELIQLYNLQMENMRLMIQEQGKREVAIYMQKLEMKMMALLKQKDEEIVKVAQRAKELQNFIRKLEIENQAWQRLASDNEAMITNLNNQIEQVKDNDVYKFNLNNNAIEDVGSCCVQDIDNKEKETEDGYNGTSERRMLCRSCNARDSCVLFLPCRHLSSCQACEPFLTSCPVCYMTKSSTIEAIMS